MTASARCTRAVLISLFIIFLASSIFAQQPLKFDAATVSGLPARNIGSATMSGRIAALDAVVRNGRLTMFVGSASGGVWKSVNGGTTFKPVFDRQDVQSIGAEAIDPSNPEIVWVGTGESWVRNSVSVGDGVYKSIDGGENWTNVGLKDSEHIAKILVDPKDSNTVYACGTGHLWDDNDERGVYKNLRRRQDVEESSSRPEWLDRLWSDRHEPACAKDNLRFSLGFPQAGLDVSLRWARQRIICFHRRRRTLDRPERHQQQEPAGKALGTSCCRSSAFEAKRGVRQHRIEKKRAISLR